MTSTTFINREIYALERQGIEVMRYSVRPWDTPLVANDDKAEHSKTKYLLTGNLTALLIGFLFTCLMKPIGVLRAAIILRRLIAGARGGIIRHTAYFLQAGYFVGLAEKDRIDHVHAHFGTNATAVAMLAKAMGGPSYSFTVHGPDELNQNVIMNYSLKVQHAAFVAAISDYCRSQILLFSSDAYADKIKIIHCGLELDHFEPSPVPQNKSLLCIGRLCPQKGQMMIPAAVAALKAEHPDIKVVLVGDGEMRTRLEAEIERHGVGEQIALKGWRDGAEIRQFLRECRVFLLPSSAEGLPVVLMEALAMGRPAISTFIAGIPELIDEDCGWIIPAGSPQALTAAMRAALNANDEMLAVKARNGRARVLERHNIDREAARLREAFATAIEAGSRS